MRQNKSQPVHYNTLHIHLPPVTKLHRELIQSLALQW